MLEKDPTAYFGSIANYAEIRPPYPAEALDWVIQQTGLKPGARVIDIGAGDGLLGLAFAKKGFRVTLVDTDKEALGKASLRVNDMIKEKIIQEGQVNTSEHAAHSTGIIINSAEDQADLIVVGNAAHWFAISEKAGEIPAEWERILKPNGKVAFFCMTPSVANDDIAHAVHEVMERDDKFDAYRTRQTHVLNERDKTRSHADLLLAPGYDFRSQQEVVPGKVDQVVQYLDTTLTLRQMLQEVPAARGGLERVAWHTAMQDVPSSSVNRDGYPTSANCTWDCDVYLGQPRTEKNRNQKNATGSFHAL